MTSGARISVFVLAALWAFLTGASSAGALEFSGYFDGLAAFSRVSDDYRGGTAAPGFFPGTLTLSSGPLNCPVPVTPLSPCPANLGEESDFGFAAAEFKLQLEQDFEDLVQVRGSLSLHSAASGTSIAASGASADGQFDFLVRELAAEFTWPRWRILAGRFYAPIGLEGIDADTRPTATLGTSTMALVPFFLTGVLVGFSPEDSSWSGFVFAANDLRGGNDDANSAKALGVGAYRMWRGISVTAQYHLDWTNSLAPELEDATQLLALTLQGEGESLFGGLETLWRHENASNVALFPPLTGTADIFSVMGLAGWRWESLTIGVRGEWIHISDPDAVMAGSAVSARLLAPSAVLIGDGDVLGASLFVTWAIVRGVFVRAEYRIDGADYDRISTTPGFVNPDTATAHLGVVQLNASFE